MATIDDLPPDQRATLQLLLTQGRSYDEIAQMLRIDPSAVRERARAGLDALGPDEIDDLPLEHQDDIADYLLGQQTASRRQATRELLEHSPSGRAWARVVAGELRPLAGDNLPEIPAEAAEVDEAFDALTARHAHRRNAERSSRVGGIILLGGLAIALVVLVLLLTGALGDDGDDNPSGGGGTTTAATTETEPEIEAQINLLPPDGASSKAAGVARIARQGDQRALQIIAQDIRPPAREGRYYALWLYSSPQKAKLLGFPDPQPGKDGRLATQTPLAGDADEYDELVITRETQAEPEKPGTIVLRARLAKE